MADEEKYDVIVVGAGHAGCKATLPSARTDCKTPLFLFYPTNMDI
ncbi:MAG: FAD-dependent oxidoreductase [candidate division Zixibacteria bacterium]|nr:FAD-dependent oxidoreductase [candidate division Zixibacteria bacterium]